MIKDFLSKSTSFVKDKLKILKSTTGDELIELKKLENKLIKLQEEEKVTQDSVVWSGKTMLRFWLTGLFVVFVWYISFASLDIVYLVITALIVSIAIEAVIEFFQKLMPRWFSIGLSYVLLIVFVLSGFLFIIPFLLWQLSVFLNMVMVWVWEIQILIQTHTLVEIVHQMSWLPEYFQQKILVSFGDPDIWPAIQQKLQDNMAEIVGKWTTYVKDLWNLAVIIFAWFFSFVAKFFIVLTLSVLFSVEKNHVIKFISYLWGKKKRAFLRVKMERIYKKLWLWLKGQLLLCVFIWVMMLLSLWVLTWFGFDIPQKWSLATIAGLTELIPYLWPVLWGVPAIIVVLLHNGFYGGLLMAGIILLIQWVENNVLIPVVMNKTLWINPVTIFLSMLLWGLIMGFVGVLLAVPIAVILTMFLDDKFED